MVALLCVALPSLFGHGDLGEAIEAVTQAIADSPQDAALFLRRAELHRLHEDWPAAEADYALAVKLQPTMRVVKFCRAEMRLAQGRENEALLLLDDFLATTPAHAGGRALRAGILENRGNWKKADTDLAVAVASSPESHYVTKRAELLERHGQPAAAVRCLDDASHTRGRIPVLEQQALEIEERAGKADAALQRLDNLIANEPRRDIWLVRKAGLLEKAGRRNEAREAWVQADEAFQKLLPEKRELPINRELAAQIAAGKARSNEEAK